MIRIDNQYTGDYWIIEETNPPPDQSFTCQHYMSSGHHLGKYNNMALEAIKSAITAAVDKDRQKYTREQQAREEILGCLNTQQ